MFHLKKSNINDCQKSKKAEPEYDRLRIKKILHFSDDNFDPSATETFDYNANGLLKSIIYKTENNLDNEYLINIEYNKEKQPIKILSYSNKEITADSYSIEWSNTGFIAKHLNTDYGNRVECVLDSRNQIVSSKYGNDDTNWYQHKWINGDSLVILKNNLPVCKYKLLKRHSIYKGINIAILAVLEIGMAVEFEDNQNLYCPELMSYTNQTYHSEWRVKASYEFNEQDFPISATFRFNDYPEERDIKKYYYESY